MTRKNVRLVCLVMALSLLLSVSAFASGPILGGGGPAQSPLSAPVPINDVFTVYFAGGADSATISPVDNNLFNKWVYVTNLSGAPIDMWCYDEAGVLLGSSTAWPSGSAAAIYWVPANSGFYYLKVRFTSGTAGNISVRVVD